MKIEKEKDLQVFIVLTPVYEGWPNDKSLLVFDEVAEVKKATFFQQSVEKQKQKVIINNPFQVFFINEVGADAFLGKVEEFEEGNCL